MLKIFNLLRPFFENVYREISVREYARLLKLSPPTAAGILRELEKENLLASAKQGIYLFFRPQRENFLFQGLSRLYWQDKLFSVTADLHKQVLFKKIVLFGSLAKVENYADSDVDLYLDIEKRGINTADLEKKMRRKVQLHFKESSNNLHLKRNIEQGVRIR